MKTISRSILLASLLVLAACQSTTQFKKDQFNKDSQEIPSTLPAVSALGDELVRDKNFAGASFAVIKDGRWVHYSAHGVYGIDNPKPIAENTLFRIFSMTKPITAVAAMMLYEEGKFALDDPVAKYLPQFASMRVLNDDGVEAPAKNPITIRQLLTHSAGFTYGFAPDSPTDILYQQARLFESATLDQFIDKLVALPLRFEPGTRYRYSVSIDVVGKLVEQLSGQDLNTFFVDRIFNPLNMSDTFFEIPADKMHRLASDQYWNPETGQIELMPVEYARNFAEVGLYMGGGGLVSTLGDYVRFCQMILNGGELDGARLLQPDTVTLMLSDHLAPEVRSAGGPYPDINIYDGQSMGLGFAVIYDESQLPEEYVQNEVSWGGLAGTQFWINPAANTAGVAMVQLARQPWRFDEIFRVAAQRGLDALEAQR